MLAAAGSSIGLGNIWKFPYETGLHHGGTFLLVYIPCALLVAFPLMIAEVVLGKYGRSNPIQGIREIAKQERLSSLWQTIGWLGLLTSFLIFTFYSVVASWILFFLMQSLSGAFVGMPAEIVQHSFGALLRNSDQMLLWHSVFVLLVVVVLRQGLHRGLERAIRVLMLGFIALLVWLCIFASQVGDFDKALTFLTTIDLDLIDAELIVSALTQALFSLTVGLGALLMFGAYWREGLSIVSATAMVTIFDTLIALLMAVMIFSIVFAFGMAPDSGPGLIFETLPVAFSQMANNSIAWSSLFFLLLLITSMISALALLEPIVAWMTNAFAISRRLAAWLIGSLAWLGGLASLYSFNDLKFSFFYFGEEKYYGVFDSLNILTIHVLLPLIGLLLALFVGWRIRIEQTQIVLSVWFRPIYSLWLFCTRWLVPLILTAVLILVMFYPV